MMEDMIKMVEEDASVTLQEIAQKIASDYGLDGLSTMAVDNHLQNRLYTVKKVHVQSETANTPENKVRRREFVEKLAEAMGRGRCVAYVNFHCRRSICRAPKGSRAPVDQAASKDLNIHMVGGLTQHGIFSFMTKRGYFEKEDANKWLQGILRDLTASGVDTMTVTVVADNTPCHSRMEEIVLGSEFAGAEVLRLGPYSPALNPIEWLSGLFGKQSLK